MISFIIWTILFYLLFRFIFNFVIPVFRVTRQMKNQVNEFREKMQTGQSFAQEDGYARSAPKRPASKPKVGEYIDFEEIK